VEPNGKRPLRFGLSLPNRAVLFGMPAALLLETAEQADASGAFDSVWVGDNFLSKPRLEAIVTLSALAARTRTLKLGTICLASFPLRHPLLLALQWASLDVLSGGRTILTVCNGGAARMGPAFAAELAASGSPVWVVHAEEKGDGGLTDAERATLEAAPNVTLVTIPGAVFLIPDEAPQSTAAVIADALKQAT